LKSQLDRLFILPPSSSNRPHPVNRRLRLEIVGLDRGLFEQQ
jgi:hypothetical protein